jgi:ribonuclease Z
VLEALMTNPRSCVIAVIGLLAMSPVAAQSPQLRVTLLGTGTPLPRADRLGPSTLVEAGRERLLFDCGRGCTIRLFERRIPFRDVRLFLTHLHSDHVTGVPDLWLTGWLGAPALHAGGTADNRSPLWVRGPAGTNQLMAGLRQAFGGDITMRTAQERLPPLAADVAEISPGIVFENAGVRVTAFAVDHGEFLKPAFGYRVDYQGRSVVISGDTRYSENLIAHASGSDVIVHEVAMAASALANSPAAKEILSLHTSPREAGRIFAATKPRLAVYTHFAVAGGVGAAAPTIADFIEATRETYSGALEAGEDLMTITIGDTVVVERPKR